MPDIWQSPTQEPPFNVGTVLLLTDGSLFAQNDFTVEWWRLWPDQAGSYVNGTWKQAASTRKRRRYFASAVLADGRVFLAGGKNADDPNKATDLLAIEIYDPVSDSWSDVSPPDWDVIGNAPCCVLPNGTVLLGNINTGQCRIYDPDADDWLPTGTKENRSAAEESWTLLPDGSVLTADYVGHPKSERYINGGWRDEGDLRSDLVRDPAGGLGPAVLRPDGTVFALGATGVTQIFTPDPDPTKSGKWEDGPPLPKSNGRMLSAKDAPACLLPDGSVLFVASVDQGTISKDTDNPPVLLRYDGHTVTPLGLQPGNANGPTYWTRLLLLPNGQVLFVNSTPKIQFYNPDGKCDPKWQPSITQAPRRIVPGQSYVLRGRQLNGLSQACVFGDDASMATNYPIIRLRQDGPSAKTVIYCRTYGHSTMGVATGNADQATSFSVPTRLKPGAYVLEVIANGIASDSVNVTVLSAGKAAAAAAVNGGRDTESDLALQEEMFWRDLNEVHMLMDHISGRNDKSLMKLTDVPDLAKGSTSLLTPQEAVHRVCLIRFPPIGSLEDKADQAALLLLVKDRLNALASPARGLTIAFTSMFSAITNAERFLPSARAFDGQDMTQRRRSGFVMAAYPNLEPQARRFRTFFKALPWITAVWFAFTAFTSWDVLVSSQTLQKAVAEFQALPSTAVNDATCHIATAATGRSFTPGSPPPPAIAAQCNTLLGLEETSSLPSAASYAARISCADLFIGPSSWLHPVGFTVRMLEEPFPKKADRLALAASGQPKPDDSCGTLGSCEFVSDVNDFSATVINVFSNNILPMMFGLLGTFSGLMRSITAKVRDNTLSPRDFRLSLSLLPMGVIAGLTVGLIISPNAGSSDSGTVGTLSATALAFLAGYGAEFYFNTLDTILGRIFPQTANAGQAGAK